MTYKQARQEEAITTLNELALAANTWANTKGFWKVPVTDYSEIPELTLMKKTQKIMLVVTELAELVEGLRKPAPQLIVSDVAYSNEEEEVADALIRLFDYAGQYGLRLGEVVLAKMAFNEGRPFKHGKEF